MSTEVDGSQQLLFAWFSPAFPTGGFAWSHGLEMATLQGFTQDEKSLGDWLEDLVLRGGLWNDAVLFGLAHQSARAGDHDAVADTADLAAALAPSRERLSETLGQGSAFLAAVRTGWPGASPWDGPIAYPVAAGAACGLANAPLRHALEAYLTATCANLIAAGVRLGVCGQSGGVRVLARLQPHIGQAAQRAESAGEVDLGSCAFAADIASMRHETLDGRLFLS